jgi:hypothetical protein
VECAADVEAVRRDGSGRGQVLAHSGPHVALPVFVHAHPAGVARGKPPEEAPDQEHDLTVGVVVGVAERQLGVLVPPFRPVPDVAVAQQVLFQFGETRPQVADLHADRVAVQARRFLGGLGTRGVRVRGGRIWIEHSGFRPLVPLEDVVRGAVDGPR